MIVYYFRYFKAFYGVFASVIGSDFPEMVFEYKTIIDEKIIIWLCAIHGSSGELGTACG